MGKGQADTNDHRVGRICMSRLMIFMIHKKAPVSRAANQNGYLSGKLLTPTARYEDFKESGRPVLLIKRQEVHKGSSHVHHSSSSVPHFRDVRHCPSRCRDHLSFSKTFSPRFSNDWRTPSHPRHHRTLDLREGLGCSLIEPSANVSSLCW